MKYELGVAFRRVRIGAIHEPLFTVTRGSRGAIVRENGKGGGKTLFVLGQEGDFDRDTPVIKRPFVTAS